MSFDTLFLDELAAALTRIKLDAILVGNAASVLHGAPILTQDADLLIRDTPLNRRKIARLVEEMGGVGPVDIHENVSAKRIHFPDVYIDVIFDKIAGKLSFNSVRSRSSRITVSEHSLNVASLEDIIKSKTAANREKDRAALPILRTALAVQRARAKK